MTGGAFLSYLLLVPVAGIWLLLLLVSLLSGATRGRTSMRWRERLLILASVFLLVILGLGWRG